MVVDERRGRGLERGTGLAVWSSDPWRELAENWLDERLAAAGTRRTGAVRQQQLRPWATVLTAPTTAGPVWMKACGPETAFEVGLYELLDRVAPDRVLSPLATDVTRGWLLLPDGGTPLGDRSSGTELAEALVTVLPQYGQLQRDVAPRVGELLALGVTDMRPAVLPERFDFALNVVENYAAQYGSTAARSAYRQVTGMHGAVAEWSLELAAAPGPPSVDHNDLHPWNVLPGAAVPGQARFYDWGDAVVAHPFASALVALGYLQTSLEVGPHDRQVLRVRDAYLEVFGDLAPHAELVRSLELACRLAKVARALTWHRSLRAEGYEAAGEFATAPLESLISLLDDSYLGGA